MNTKPIKQHDAKHVELTIVPLDSENNLSSFQQFLLDSPEMTDDEYLNIQDKRQHFDHDQLLSLSGILTYESNDVGKNHDFYIGK